MICDRNPVDTNCDCGITCQKYKYQEINRATRHPLPTTLPTTISTSCPIYLLRGTGGVGGGVDRITENQEHHHHPTGGKDCNDGEKERRQRQRDEMSVSERGLRWIGRRGEWEARCDGRLLPSGEWHLSKCVYLCVCVCVCVCVCEWACHRLLLGTAFRLKTI